ncbi:hypothetical protein AUP68_08051 [Ilyonectria robusta]
MDKCNPDYKDAQWAYYRFEPSVAVNVLFIVLFGISSLLHGFQIWKTKTWYLSALVAGGVGMFCDPPQPFGQVGVADLTVCPENS